MGILKRRDRLLVFRLTQEEYAHLRAACTEKGSRSLSDFARSELLEAIAADGGPEQVIAGISRVGQRLTELEVAVERLMQRVDGMAVERAKGQGA